MTPLKHKTTSNTDQDRIAVFCKDRLSLSILRDHFMHFWGIPYEINPASHSDFLANLVYESIPTEGIAPDCSTLVLPTVSETWKKWLGNQGAKVTVDENAELRLTVDGKTQASLKPRKFYRYHGNKLVPFATPSHTALLTQLCGSTISLLSVDVVEETRGILDAGLHPRMSKLLKIYAGTPLRYSVVPAKLRNIFLRVTAKTRERTTAYSGNCPLDTLRFLLLMSLNAISRKPIPKRPFWKDGKKYACCMTHDIETIQGLTKAKWMLTVERKYGLRSAWNIPSDRFQLREGIIRELAQWGEIGAHGTLHDGKLAALEESKILERMQRCKGKLERIVERDISGFRAPLLQCNERIARTARKAGFRYDSSCPTWEPASTTSAGAHGVGTIFPIILDDFVEIPITLPQDHQMLSILGRAPQECVNTWIEMKNWIREIGGLCTILVHPDYDFGESANIDAYEQLVRELAGDSQCWLALPCEIAEWWLNRCQQRVSSKIIQTKE